MCFVCVCVHNSFTIEPQAVGSPEKSTICSVVVSVEAKAATCHSIVTSKCCFPKLSVPSSFFMGGVNPIRWCCFVAVVAKDDLPAFLETQAFDFLSFAVLPPIPGPANKCGQRVTKALLSLGAGWHYPQLQVHPQRECRDAGWPSDKKREP